VARAVVIGVVGGRAVGKVAEAKFALDRLERVEELFFAVKAAIWMVALVSFELDLVGGDLDEPRPKLSSHRAGLFLL
jgi:hypothetical protein